MIKIKISILGALLKPNGLEKFDHVCPSNTTILELLRSLKYNSHHIKYIMSSINNETKDHNHILKDNDEVTLFTVVGGG